MQLNTGGWKSIQRLRPLFMLLMAGPGCAHGVRAAKISFGFSGTIVSAQAGTLPLPAGIQTGQAFTGTMSYDTAAAAMAAENPPKPDYSAFYFSSGTSFSLWVNTAGHFFSTSPAVTGNSLFNIIIWNGFDGFDQFSTDDALTNFRADDAPFPAGHTGGFSLYLSDQTTTALSDDSLPTTAPTLPPWTTLHRFELVVNNPAKELAYHFMGLITNLTASPAPVLTIHRKSPTEVVLSWPVLLDGYVVESASSLEANDWAAVATAKVDTETEHQVTQAIGATPRIFRLKQ